MFNSKCASNSNFVNNWFVAFSEENLINFIQRETTIVAFPSNFYKLPFSIKSMFDLDIFIIYDHFIFFQSNIVDIALTNAVTRYLCNESCFGQYLSILA